MNTHLSLLRSRIAALPYGELFAPADLMVEGDTKPQAQAFSFLLREGEIKRFGKGLYVATTVNRFLPGRGCPAMEDVIESLARRTGETIVPIGAREANVMRLSTQVPVVPAYCTSGPAREYRLGNLRVYLRHQPEAYLLQPGLPGAVLRAVECMGKASAVSSCRKLAQLLPVEEWSGIVEASAGAPKWMKDAIEGAFGEQRKDETTSQANTR